MVFKCQENSFLKEFITEVVSCTPANFEITQDGKKQSLDGFEVICKDTILFPEGGGQPFDEGFLNGAKVYKVARRGDEAIHYVTEELSEGTLVRQKIDWPRRFDHMQQHSGQHLLSAVILRDYGATTVSWWLGEEDCYVELDCPEFQIEKIQDVESTLNNHILEGRNVSIQIIAKDTPEDVLQMIRSIKALPEDHVGDIRVIHIEGIDSNMCCGTHVNNLNQLQCIKILFAEKSKRKGNCLLHFLVGKRILKKLQEANDREQQLTTLLNNGPLQHVDLITKLLRNMKTTNKNLQSTLKELAIIEAQKIKCDPAKYYIHHRKEAEPDYMNTILREVGNIEKFLFLSVGEVNGFANILLYGEKEDLAKLGENISGLLGGKGAGKGKRYQAKVTSLSNMKQVHALLAEYFQQ